MSKVIKAVNRLKYLQKQDLWKRWVHNVFGAKIHLFYFCLCVSLSV